MVERAIADTNKMPTFQSMPGRWWQVSKPRNEGERPGTEDFGKVFVYLGFGATAGDA